MFKELILLGIGCFFGLGAALVPAAAPQYFPNAPTWVWHWSFWGGLVLMVVMLADGLVLLQFGSRLIRMGPALLANVGVFALACAIIWQFEPPEAKSNIAESRAITKQSAEKTAPNTDEILPKTLIGLFQEGFPELLKLNTEVTANFNDGTKVTFPMSIYQDYKSNADFIGFYIPKSPHVTEIISHLATGYKEHYDRLKHDIQISAKDPADLAVSKSETLIFSGRVYIYQEDELSLRQIADLTDLYQKNGLSVQFRGQDYAVGEWMQRKLKAR